MEDTIKIVRNTLRKNTRLARGTALCPLLLHSSFHRQQINSQFVVIFLDFDFFFRFGIAHSLTALQAEKEKWEVKDYEADLAKLEKEAEKRLEEKIEDMKSKVAKTGA
jgi:hypothetical protein